MKPSPISLTDRIRNASTLEEIAALLAEGEQYEQATRATRNRWKRKARQRNEQIKRK